MDKLEPCGLSGFCEGKQPANHLAFVPGPVVTFLIVDALFLLVCCEGIGSVCGYVGFGGPRHIVVSEGALYPLSMILCRTATPNRCYS